VKEALKGNSREVYEVKEEHVDEIYNSIKKEMTKMFEKYKVSDNDLTIAIMASYCISNTLKQGFSDQLGAYKIIKMVEAKDK
jgi:hypothetical protein